MVVFCRVCSCTAAPGIMIGRNDIRRGQAEIVDLPRTHKPNAAAETKGSMPIWARSRTPCIRQREGKAPCLSVAQSYHPTDTRLSPHYFQSGNSHPPIGAPRQKRNYACKLPVYHPGAHPDWWVGAIADKYGGHSLSFWNKTKIRIMRLILSE